MGCKRLRAIAAGLLCSALLLAHPLAANAQIASGDCPSFRWTTLGTAGGPHPTSERSEPANLLEAAGETILVDAGDGAVGQLARAGRAIGDVQSVFISHLHLDHTAGLGGVIGLRWMNNYPGKLRIYGPPGTKELVDGIVASMAPPARIGFGIGQTPSRPRESVEAVELRDGQILQVGSVSVRAVANNHFDGAGNQTARVGAKSFSYRFAFGNRSITYTGDSGPDARVTALARGSEMLVSEVIDVDGRIEALKVQRPDMGDTALAATRLHFSTHHVTPEDVGRMSSEAAVGRVVLTHFVIPGSLGTSAPTIYAGVRAAYAGEIELARDLSSFDVGCKSG